MKKKGQFSKDELQSLGLNEIKEDSLNEDI